MFFLVDFHIYFRCWSWKLILQLQQVVPSQATGVPCKANGLSDFQRRFFGECRPNFGRCSVKLRFATTLLLATKSKRDCRKMVENWIRIWVSICPSLGNMFLSTRSGWIKKMVFFWYVKVKIQQDPTDILIIIYTYYLYSWFCDMHTVIIDNHAIII